MPRKPKNDAELLVSQARASAKEYQKRAKQLLKNAQLNVREYRKELAALKKQQIVSKRINAAKHVPTRYMLRKIKKFKGVATGHELAVPIAKLSPHRAREYTEKGIAQRIDKFLIVPKTAAKQRADIFKGHLRTTQPIGRGEIQIIKFPTRLEDMHDVLRWLGENEQTLMDMKSSRDQFGFQLQGHNSLIGLPNVKELITYLSRYDGSTRERGNIFNGHSKEVRKEFVLFRFRPAPRSGGRPSLEPYFGEKRISRKHAELRGRQKHLTQLYQRDKAAKRKAKQRLNETKEEREARLQYQREYRKRKKENAND